MIASVILLVIYGILLVVFSIVWLTHRGIPVLGEDSLQNCGFSIIVVVRNEVRHIESLLESVLKLRGVRFELILINDDSDDQTIAIAERYLDKLDLRIINLLPNERLNSPKKAGITKALGVAKHDLVFCTDGDCILPKDILLVYGRIFSNEKVMFVSGPVTFGNSTGGVFQKFWNQILSVEFASLVGSAAVSIFMNKPNMCSGANLAYRKAAFLEVNGYAGNLDLASGDDEFLMHKIHTNYPEGVVYAKNANAIVRTQASESLRQFYQQRKRWSSKWSHYGAMEPKLLAAFVFLVNFMSICLLFSDSIQLLWLRIIPEFVFLSLVLTFLKKQNSIWLIPFVQLIYPFYVVFFGINSLFFGKTYNWKGRKLK